MRTTRKAFFVAGALLMAALTASPALAAELRHGEQPAISGGEQVVGDAYIVGGSVTSAGSVGGDLYAAGGNVVVSGPVATDAVVAGGNVTIFGGVGDDLRAAGGTVVIGGEVKGDVVVGAGQVTISGPVGGDIVWGGGTLRIDAPVEGNLVLGGGEVTINAPIKGSVRFDGGKLSLGPTASIGGDLSYRAEEPVKLADGATVAGATTYDQRPKEGKAKKDWGGDKKVPAAAFAAGIAAFAAAMIFLKLLTSVVASLVLGLVFRRRAVALAQDSLKRPWSMLGWGFATLVLVPAATIVLAVTIVGLPLAGLLGIAYVGLMLVARLAVPVVAGSLLDRWVMKRPEYRVTWATILVGVLVTGVLHFIPILGWLALAILCLIVFGTLAKATWEGVRGMRG